MRKSEISKFSKMLVDGMLDAAIIVDGDRNVLAFNKKYETSIGLNTKDLQGKIDEGAKCFDLMGLDLCKASCAVKKCMEKEVPLRFDGNKINGTKENTCIVAATPLENGLFLETYRDVNTESRNSKDWSSELKNTAKEKERLEGELRKRTEELTQAHDQMVLQEKLSALGRLVAGIAHELNNPINFVYGNIDFAQKYIEDLVALVSSIDEDPALPESMKRRLEGYKKAIDFEFLKEDSVRVIASLRSGTERSVEIVRDLKSFSRTDGHDFQQIDIIKQIESTLNLINPLIKTRITIKRDYDKELPLIYGNNGHINQVLMNILSNAAQAIEGEGEIIIQVGKWLDRGLSVVIADSGPGIKDDVAEKILEPFFTTKEAGSGTGLGLWITQNIVRNHGGKMMVFNRPEGGACFEIKLPEHPPNLSHLKK